MLIFSPNMLKTYENCPKKYYFQYIEKVNVPKNSTPFEKGKKIHALAHYYLQKVDISKIQNALTPQESEVWQTLLSNPYFLKKCLKTEYQLFCKISDIWIGGRLDAVMQDEKNYYILDYKTGAIPQNPQYDYQTMIYLLCFDKIIKGEYTSLEFLYLNLKQKHNHVIQFTPDLKAQYISKIIKITSSILSDKIYKPNCTTCTNCEYKNLCSKNL